MKYIQPPIPSFFLITLMLLTLDSQKFSWISAYDYLLFYVTRVDLVTATTNVHFFALIRFENVQKRVPTF